EAYVPARERALDAAPERRRARRQRAVARRPAAGARRVRGEALSRFDLVVFDWDGTLVDSLGRIVAALRATIDELGLPSRPEHELRAGVGLGFDEVVRRLFPELDVADRARVRAVFREHFLAGDAVAQLFPGAREALESLAKDGLTL